jgi:ABC-type nitrate/sulfonate/bicarbonate transport system permease component
VRKRDLAGVPSATNRFIQKNTCLRFFGCQGRFTSRSQIFIKVLLPNSLPYLFSGLKIAITLSVVGALVGEWVGADSGLGYLIQIANSQIDTPLMFAAFVVLVVIGMVLFALIALLEWLIMPWHPKVDVFVTM